ncbi:aminotransferase [Palleronia sp. LCG004]|uniref:aminotransferase n=1 Tax=Palleronia sp. LCG004 TaxID=3079304 RepID=UPI002943B73C|nr:aminotransferase [Palleronia sp. LCG004]WOI57908.1 aminotransferase [Palleronia sp. LCG004]
MNERISETAALDAAHAVHPHTNLRRHLQSGPNMIVKGDGIEVIDAQGKRYIEGAAGLWCAALGFGSERLGEVAKQVMTDIGYYHTFRGASTPWVSDLSAKLGAIAPKGLGKVLLQTSGSEANDTAMKLVWSFWEAQGEPARVKIISRHNSYHGTGALTSQLTGKANFHVGFGPSFDRFRYVTEPYHYRKALPGETEAEFSSRLAQELDDMILAEGPETVAAFWAEPVIGSGGVFTPPEGYFPKIQAVLDKYGILFVADEVICGFGRTGEMWGSQTYGIRPDLICCAKSLSAAMLPLSAVLIGERVFEAMLNQSDKYGTFTHGYTYGGHPVSCAVAAEVLTIYEEMDLIGHVKSVEPAFVQGFESLRDHPLVGDVNAVGLIGCAELVADKQIKAKHATEVQITARFEAAALERGLITRNIGNRIALSPPQIITAAEVEEMFSRYRDALDAVAKEIA